MSTKEQGLQSKGSLGKSFNIKYEDDDNGKRENFYEPTEHCLVFTLFLSLWRLHELNTE